MSYSRAERNVRTQLHQLDERLLYHNAGHTLDYVAPTAIELATMEASEEGFSLDDILAIGVMALFHDAGFLDTYGSNEPYGVKRLEQYVKENGDKRLVSRLSKMSDGILNTNMKELPKDSYQRILRDSDLVAMGVPEFPALNQALRDESLSYPESGLHKLAQDEKTWADAQLQFLLSHHWFTSSANGKYTNQKEVNITAFRKKYGITS